MKWPLVCLASIPPIEPYLSEHRARPGNFSSQLSFAAILFEREQYFTALYNRYSRYGESPPADHAKVWRPYPATPTALKILHDLNHWTSGAPPPEHPYDLFGLKEESLNGLQSVLRPVKTHRLGYLFASRFSTDLCRHEEARNFERIAIRLAPRRSKSDNYLARQNADFEALRKQAWRVRARAEGNAFTRFIKSEGEFCEEERDRAMAGFNVRKVPKALRKLVPLARQLGVGDDPCRAYFVNQISIKNRKRIVQDAEPHLGAIEDWVKTFDVKNLPPEAAAFFWLVEAIEEMREIQSHD